MKKFIVLAFAMIMACASCSGEDAGSSSVSGNALVSDSMNKGVNVKESEMPFGATMTDLYPDDVPVAISYENRFMTAEEAQKISDYMYAINTKDAGLMEQACYPAYLDYLVEQYGNTDLQDYMDTRYDVIKNTCTGGDFTFNFIIVNSLMNENDDDAVTGFSQLDTKLPSGVEITSRKRIEVEVLYNVEGDNGSYSLSNRQGSDSVLYIYTIDGQIYIL